MQNSVVQTAESGMKTQKFLQGARRKTILGELHNKVAGREIERTFKLQIEESSFCIAKLIYGKLKEISLEEPFYLLRVGIIQSIITQTQYELEEYEQSFRTKIILNLYEKEQAAVKIKSPPVRKHKKVKVKEERKFFLPSVDGRKPERDIQEIFRENISHPLKEGNSWKKEKYQIFVKMNSNIFTIAISQREMLKVNNNGNDRQDEFPLRRIEIEYQGTQWSDLSEPVQAKEREQPGQQESTEVGIQVEKEIIRQIRKISQKVLKICENEWCSLLTRV